jgi:hypothetical protein
MASERFSFIERIMRSPGFGWEEWGQIGNAGLWETFQSTLLRLDTMIYSLNYLWPTFAEVDGLVLREEGKPWTTKRLQEYWTLNRGLSAEQIEFLVNHLHLIELVRNSPAKGEIDETVWWYFAETVAEMWRCRLKQQFPDKRFHVEVHEGYGLEIWLWTIRDDNKDSTDSPSPLPHEHPKSRNLRAMERGQGGEA